MGSRDSEGVQFALLHKPTPQSGVPGKQKKTKKMRTQVFFVGKILAGRSLCFCWVYLFDFGANRRFGEEGTFERADVLFRRNSQAFACRKGMSGVVSVSRILLRATPKEGKESPSGKPSVGLCCRTLQTPKQKDWHPNDTKPAKGSATQGKCKTRNLHCPGLEHAWLLGGGSKVG